MERRENLQMQALKSVTTEWQAFSICQHCEEHAGGKMYLPYTFAVKRGRMTCAILHGSASLIAYGAVLNVSLAVQLKENS